MEKCKYCDKLWTELNLGLKKGDKANHSRWCEKNPKSIEDKKKLSIKCKFSEINIRNYITEESRKKQGNKIKKAWKDGKYDSSKMKSWLGKNLPIEMKLKISKSLKKAHENGSHPGWAHINTSKTNRSKPEEIFYSWILNDEYLSLLNIEEKKPFGKYFLDFAFIDFKIDVELDGIQHLRSKESIDHDILRDKFVIENGWIPYRISVSEFYKDKIKTIENLKYFIESLKNNKKDG
jgi:very-short-patch-repair endonuclease